MHYLNPEPVPGVYDPARADEIQAFLPGEGEHYVLPEDVTKARAIVITVAVLVLLGATPTDIMVFRHVADTTERTAWHSSERAPVNWRRQCEMARECGLSERQFRRIEERLMRFGVLARCTADNGYRGRRSGQGYGAPVQCGLSLEPAIANHAAFVALQAAAEAREAQRQELVWHVRSAKRRVHLLASGVRDLETRSWAQGAFAELCEDFAGVSLRGLEMAVLEMLHADLLDLERRIGVALTPLSLDSAEAQEEHEAPCPSEMAEESAEALLPSSAEDHLVPEPDVISTSTDVESRSVENTGKQQDMSAAPDMDDLCHIQPKSNINESCNVSTTSISPSAKADEPISSALHPNGRNDYLENKDRRADQWINPAILQRLDDTALRDLASEDAALYLDAVDDWRDCLPYLLRELGVNTSAWLDAVDLMGEEIAFIALLVIDRNRFHPVTPVLNPGGALRAFTDRARRDELNLTRAVLGIWERDRQGKQPKSGSRVVQ